MFRRFRPRLTYANVTATMALLVALGGSAVAASYVISKNRQLGPGTVAGSAPPSGKHDNIINGSINFKDIKPNGIRGGRILESSLGTVPRATVSRKLGKIVYVKGVPTSNPEGTQKVGSADCPPKYDVIAGTVQSTGLLADRQEINASYPTLDGKHWIVDMDNQQGKASGSGALTFTVGAVCVRAQAIENAP